MVLNSPHFRIVVCRQLTPLLPEFLPLLKKLSTLNGRECALVVLKARQLIMRQELPSNQQVRGAVYTASSVRIGRFLRLAVVSLRNSGINSSPSFLVRLCSARSRFRRSSTRRAAPAATRPICPEINSRFAFWLHLLEVSGVRNISICCLLSSFHAIGSCRSQVGVVPCAGAVDASGAADRSEPADRRHDLLLLRLVQTAPSHHGTRFAKLQTLCRHS